MSRLEVYVLAAIYTGIMMFAISTLPEIGGAPILAAVANVWFWVGRMSTQPWPTDDRKWGRS
ncbi:MAG: hypothetical protein CMJ42_22760 [Phyllobacteriaceae bacterium]|nr:hypothetical protein [Phyllobacteriaceae bacterium]MBA89213.1 hypothetical protein [Phyllobacteriaceae bacterium]